MFKKYFNHFLFCVSAILITFKCAPVVPLHSQGLDAFICISSEDEKYNVKGGIGTYLGILTKEIKRLYPQIEVYWITKSHNSFDFSEKDIYGINRYYLSDTNPYSDRPFCKHLNLTDGNSKFLLEQQVFLNKANSKLSEILSSLKGKRIAIECGEWEGVANQVFRIINDKNILKAARIHTPLAVTMLSNQLDVSTTNKLQLLNEFETLYNADCISSCTSFIKGEVIQHVLGNECNKGQQIKVIPNPVDSNNYKSGTHCRKDSITKINNILQQEFIKEDTYNIYIIGSIETRKGTELVVDAIEQVASKLPQARFCFFGHHGGNENKNLTANTKLSPSKMLEKIPEKFKHQVAFAGYVNHAELPIIIESGDAFPIMYLGDNFPGVVAEIALMEKPILALARGGLNEMLRNEKEELLAYDLGSSIQTASDNLAKGLINLYNDVNGRNEMGSKLNSLIRKKYSPEKITKDLIEYYNICLSKKH